jgi:hypothetical protein
VGCVGKGAEGFKEHKYVGTSGVHDNHLGTKVVI